MKPHKADTSWEKEVRGADNAFKAALSGIQGVSLFRQTDAITALAYIPTNTVVTGSKSGRSASGG